MGRTLIGKDWQDHILGRGNCKCYTAELIKGRGIWKNSLPQATGYFKGIVAF